MNKKIVFLHIPKTAGQSIHRVFEENFKKEDVAPIRVNHQFRHFSLNEQKRYSVFSGHLDWDRLDFVKDPKVIFTILRAPKERLASFYLYLKGKAEKASEAEINKPENRGLYLAKNLTIDEYFGEKSLPERNFIDDHYENFYTYYFAGRRYDCRREFKSYFSQKDNTFKALIERAIDNIQELDLVGDVSDLKTFSNEFNELTGYNLDFDSKKVNVNDSLQSKETRWDVLMNMPMEDTTRRILNSFVELDEELYSTIFESKGM